jgi:Copper type II ascorbate-dependent monooxygenase, C-terminal domain.
MRKSFFIIACFVSLILGTPAHAQKLTFVKDVAPIIHTKCTPCHRPNEAAPFSLITYQDVAKRTSFIKEVVESGYMPPWKANPHYVEYDNDRSLSQKEKETILQWIAEKAPRGDGKEPTIDLDRLNMKSVAAGRKPDLTLATKVNYKLPGDNEERFIVYRIPFELSDSFSVAAVEFFSNNKKIIHHANYSVHEVPEGIDINAGPDMINLSEEDRTKYDAYLPFKKTIAYYGGWIPGSSPETYPKGIGWVMPRRGVILLTIHYAPSAKEEESISGMNLYFTKEPVERKIKVISFGSGGIGEKQILPSLWIMPNKIETFTLTVANPGEDFSVLYVWPHMHLLGKEFKAYAVSPMGDTIRLTHIPQWDFRWQENYRFKKLVRIPKGSRLRIEGTYDNTVNNPFNPNNPPKLVMSTGDMKSTDEMLTLMMIFLPYKEGDENLSLEH